MRRRFPDNDCTSHYGAQNGQAISDATISYFGTISMDQIAVGLMYMLARNNPSRL
jgi:hypothetical protein